MLVYTNYMDLLLRILSLTECRRKDPTVYRLANLKRVKSSVATRFRRLVSDGEPQDAAGVLPDFRAIFLPCGEGK